MDKSAIRNAATILVLRDQGGLPAVLMGQRGARAAFMPNKFVFPGGAVDPQDRRVPLASPIRQSCADKLAMRSDSDLVHALQCAAIRELWEETGLVLGEPGNWPDPVPSDWAEFAKRSQLPTARDLRFIFRAITPPGRPRRFDARFFIVNADKINGDLDDFSQASDELSLLQWIPLAEARTFDLPFITEVVLAEVMKILRDDSFPQTVPFFKNDDEHSLFLRLGDSGLK